MTREEIVEKAWAFWDLQNQRKLDEALALLHPDGGYATICMESWDPIPNASGWLAKFLKVVLTKTDLRYERGRAIAEDDTVVWEFTGTFQIPGDESQHSQSYCMIMSFRDGKIDMIREYLDTKKEDPLVAFVLSQIAQEEGADTVPANVAAIAPD